MCCCCRDGIAQLKHNCALVHVHSVTSLKLFPWRKSEEEYLALKLLPGYCQGNRSGATRHVCKFFRLFELVCAMLSSKRRWNPKEELRRPSPELMNTNGSLPSLPSAVSLVSCPPQSLLTTESLPWLRLSPHPASLPLICLHLCFVPPTTATRLSMMDVPTVYLQLAVLTGRAVTLPVSSICIQLGGQKVRQRDAR